MLLTACVSRDNFWDKFGTVACKREEECYKADFDSYYDDQAECVDDFTDTIDDYTDCDEYCDFDADKANKCLSDVDSATCEDLGAGDYGSDCDDVWDCDNSDYTDCVAEKYGF